MKFMKLNKKLQMVVVGSLILALGACSPHKRYDQSAINEANASYGKGGEGRGVHTAGLGGESSFGDRAEGRGKEKLLSKRVYYFDFDSTVVHEGDKSAVATNANYLSSHGKKVMLEGHTDPRGSREYNIGLGERRAKAIADILTAQGVGHGQVRMVSYGAEKLAKPGHTEADYQQDRRVVLVFSD